MRRSGSIRLSFDGGSRGNPGAAYGSFRLEGRGPLADLHLLERLEFPRGTNNEAEYWTLLAGLRRALEEVRRRDLRPQDLDLSVVGDSLLVIRQLQEAWKARDARMRRLKDEALELMSQFGGHRLAHRPRRKSVAEFGH